MILHISKRLETVAGFIPKDSTVADIGSDHALLPVYLIRNEIASKAIAGELNEGPYNAAARQVAQAGLGSQISVRRGDGLSVLSSSEADVVVIAGMGGGTIVDILSRGEQEGKLRGVSRLVLQPNIGERLVREWLIAAGWMLTEEQLLKEDGVIYEVLVADFTTREHADEFNRRLYSESKDIRLLMGPYLLNKTNSIFIEKWTAYTAKLERTIEQMSQSEQPEAINKRKALSEELAGVKEVLSCLSE